jgi:hypothetical protein
LVGPPDFLRKIFAIVKEKLPRPTEVGDRISALASAIHSDSECNRRYGGRAKTQRVYGIVSNIEKVLKPGNKLKTTVVTAGFDFGENSLGIRDFKIATLNVKRCLLESALEPAPVLALAHAPSQPAPAPPPAAAAATNNMPPPASPPAAATHASLPSPTLLVVAAEPIQPALGAAAATTTDVPPSPQAIATNIPIQAELPPANNLVSPALPPANNLVPPPMNNLVGQPVLELPVNVHGSLGMLGGVISQKKEQRESVLKSLNGCWLMILSEDSIHIEP